MDVRLKERILSLLTDTRLEVERRKNDKSGKRTTCCRDDRSVY